jgi:hypothetical protein
MWDPTVSESDLIAAAKDALIHDFIMTRVRRATTASVSEGGRNMSGGQRQRLEIARALLSASHAAAGAGRSDQRARHRDRARPSWSATCGGVAAPAS